MPPRIVLAPALVCAMLAASGSELGAPLRAQTGAPLAAPASQRILGTVSAISGSAVTVEQEGASGGAVTVQLTPQTRLLRTAPGETTLKNASPMQLSDLAVGDRVLIRPNADGAAAILIAMKQGDIAQKRQGESAAWQHGASGIVQTVDAGTITLKAQGAAPPVVIHATPATVVRRYAPGSTSFADARKSTLGDIHPGDQLRARGSRGEAGLDAEEIVAGSFRNIGGTVLNADPAANTLTVTNLATKKPETLHLDAQTQLRRLPPEMAARLVRRGAGGAAGEGNGRPEAGAAATGEAQERPHGGAGEMLQRAPAITLADLKKGDAVMVVASGPGAPVPTAITVVAGVEQLLTASPEASAGLFSASWNLGGGGGAEGAPQ